MNINDERIWLAGRLTALTPTDMWDVTLATFPKLSSTHTIEVGHAAPTPDTFKRRRVALPVRWWVNEANEDAAVGDLYEALSFAPGSVVAQLLDLSKVRSVVVDDVGPEPFGPTGFLRAEMTVTITTNEADEESS